MKCCYPIFVVLLLIGCANKAGHRGTRPNSLSPQSSDRRWWYTAEELLVELNDLEVKSRALTEKGPNSGSVAELSLRMEEIKDRIGAAGYDAVWVDHPAYCLVESGDARQRDRESFSADSSSFRAEQVLADLNELELKRGNRIRKIPHLQLSGETIAQMHYLREEIERLGYVSVWIDHSAFVLKKKRK